MVKEIDYSAGASSGVFDKILVCITAQSNSKRLINEGASVADICDGELHILHVKKGNNIFDNDETPKLLSQLFLYGSEKGGMVHAFCDDDVPKSISEFIIKEKITKVVLGETVSQTKKKKKEVENQFGGILKNIPKDIEIIIVSRDESQLKDRTYTLRRDNEKVIWFFAVWFIDSARETINQAIFLQFHKILLKN